MLLKTQLIFLINLIINILLITCAPALREELCSVSLVPNDVTAKRFEESVISIRCEATLDPKQVYPTSEFTNPVFDLSFGGAPRTGVFILRGNVSCDSYHHRCWSEYKVSANSISQLIQHTGHIVYSCQVADQLRNSSDRTLARCESRGSLTYTNIVKYGDRCGDDISTRECDHHMECGSPETESEFEKQCICKNGFVSIPESSRSTICLEEVLLGLVCNYTKQCSALDTNAICDHNNGVKVCKCSPQYTEYSDYQNDYIKKCKLPSKPDDHKHEDHESGPITSSAIDPKSDKQLENLRQDPYNNSVDKSSGNFTKGPNNRHQSSGSVGIILFFLAIILAIVIVVIIIRVRNRSDKMVINKRRTTEQQTDDKDGEQTEPILAVDEDTKVGVDEVDTNEDQINNKINTINNNDTQRGQTNV